MRQLQALRHAHAVQGHKISESAVLFGAGIAPDFMSGGTCCLASAGGGSP